MPIAPPAMQKLLLSPQGDAFGLLLVDLARHGVYYGGMRLERLDPRKMSVKYHSSTTDAAFSEQSGGPSDAPIAASASASTARAERLAAMKALFRHKHPQGQARAGTGSPAPQHRPSPAPTSPGDEAQLNHARFDLLAVGLGYMRAGPAHRIETDHQLFETEAILSADLWPHDGEAASASASAAGGGAWEKSSCVLRGISKLRINSIELDRLMDYAEGFDVINRHLLGPLTVVALAGVSNATEDGDDSSEAGAGGKEIVERSKKASQGAWDRFAVSHSRKPVASVNKDALERLTSPTNPQHRLGSHAKTMRNAGGDWVAAQASIQSAAPCWSAVAHAGDLVHNDKLEEVAELRPPEWLARTSAPSAPAGPPVADTGAPSAAKGARQATPPRIQAREHSTAAPKDSLEVPSDAKQQLSSSQVGPSSTSGESSLPPACQPERQGAVLVRDTLEEADDAEEPEDPDKTASEDDVDKTASEDDADRTASEDDEPAPPSSLRAPAHRPSTPLPRSAAPSANVTPENPRASTPPAQDRAAAPARPGPAAGAPAEARSDPPQQEAQSSSQLASTTTSSNVSPSKRAREEEAANEAARRARLAAMRAAGRSRPAGTVDQTSSSRGKAKNPRELNARSRF